MTKSIRDIEAEIRHGYQGLSHIRQAYDDGEYADKEPDYYRDYRSSCNQIAKLEQQLANRQREAIKHKETTHGK